MLKPKGSYLAVPTTTYTFSILIVKETMKLELELIAISHISRLLCAFQLNLAVFTKRMSRNYFQKQDPISN